MNYKAMIKKQSTIILIAVICLTIATIGVSYALFFQVETNSNNQIVTAGSLNVSYGSGSSSINATNLLPMSDEEALTSSTMTGTIYVENKGSLPAEYEVAIGNDIESFEARTDKTDTDELLSHDFIRVAAYRNGELIVEPTTLSSLNKSLEDASLYTLFNGTLDITGTGNSTMTIVIKVWIDEEAPEEIIGDYVYLKMEIISEVDDFTAEGGEYKTANGSALLTLNNSYGGYLGNYIIKGNSVQNGTPTPNDPIEVQSVGDKTVNLINNVKSSETISGITFTINNDKSITMNGTNTSGSNIAYSIIGNSDYIEQSILLEDNTTYTLSGGVELPTGVYLQTHGKVNESTQYKTFTKTPTTFTTAESTLWSAYIRIDAGVTISNLTVYPQLEKGSTATEYEPYGKYKIPVTTKSKNIFTYQTILDSNHIELLNASNAEFNFINTSGIPETYIDAKENTQYNVSYKVKAVSEQVIHFSVYYTDGTNTNISATGVVGEYVEVSGVTAANKSVSYIKFGGGGGLKVGTTFKEIQFEEGTNKTSYAPYYNETTNIYLDEPLRKVGDYYDYIDFSKKQVIRQIASVDLGSVNFTYNTDKVNPYFTYVNSAQVAAKADYILSANYNRVSIYSMLSSSANQPDFSISIGYPSNWRGRLVVTDSRYSDAASLKSALNGVIAYFPADFEIEPEPISLPNIPINYGTTILEVDTEIAPSDVEVSYRYLD